MYPAYRRNLVPCSNCVRRHRPEHCHGANENGSSGISASARDHVSDTSETQDVGPRPESQHDTIVTDFGFPDEAPQSLAPPQYDHHDQDVSGRLQVQDLGLPHAVEPPSAPGGDPNSLPAVPLQFPTVNRASFSEAGSGRRHTPAIDNDDAGGSYGTLLCSDGGRSKYLGPTAGSEWLKDVSTPTSLILTMLTYTMQSETREMSATPAATREPSPDPSQVPGGSVGKHTGSPATPIGFPFSSAPARISTRDLLAKLPSREEAWALAEAYFRYCAWQ